MSYDEIGEQMNLSRPAVESMLFRARRGLKDEYGEITTGKRCRRMQRAMAEIAEGLGGMRERRQLLRHMAECTGCRRQATALASPASPSRPRRAVCGAACRGWRPSSRCRSCSTAGRRPESRSPAVDPRLSVQAQGIATQVSVAGNVSADHVNSVIHKAAAVVAAVAVIGGGAGVAVKESGLRIPLVEAKNKPAAPKSSQSDTSDAGAATGTEQLDKRPGAPPRHGHPAASPAAAGHGTSVAPPALGGPGAAVPGSLTPAETPGSGTNTGTAPSDGSSPTGTAPATDTPADSGGSSPTSDTGSGGGGSGGGGTTQGTPAGSTSPSTSQGTGQPTTSTGGGQPAAPITDTLPTGCRRRSKAAMPLSTTYPRASRRSFAGKRPRVALSAAACAGARRASARAGGAAVTAAPRRCRASRPRRSAG